MMLYLLFLVKYVAFPSRKDSLLHSPDGNTNSNVLISSSGSLGFYYGGKCHQSYPNSTIEVNKNTDWCSNIATSKDEKPWIQYSFQNQRMKLSGFSLRNGCCLHYYCCCVDNGSIIDYDCCCRLYSFSLLGSNDNKTWKTIHSVKEKKDFYYCKYETYEFNHETEPFQYVRLVQDEPFPSCQHCMVINEIEFYGVTVNSFNSFEDSDETEESISIIGKVRKL